MKALCVALLLVLAYIPGSADDRTSPRGGSPPATQAMKGYELYSWEAEGVWRFSLLEGTNRNKTREEVLSPKESIEGIDALKGRLQALPRGAAVTWWTRGMPELSMPPEAIVDDVEAYCREHGIDLDVGRPNDQKMEFNEDSNTCLKTS